jgi:hypothetical protein
MQPAQILTMPLLHFSIKSSKIITDMLQMLNTRADGILLLAISKISTQKTNTANLLVLESPEILKVSPLEPSSPKNKENKSKVMPKKPSILLKETLRELTTLLKP